MIYGIVYLGWAACHRMESAWAEKIKTRLRISQHNSAECITLKGRSPILAIEKELLS